MESLQDSELRAPQIEMLKACAGITESGGILMVEAGTGTGKTFAYLVPLILSGRKAIVTTRTKNLQEQLMSKDLALLSCSKPIDYAIAKGRGNYLCLRRIAAFTPSSDSDVPEILELKAWADSTATGDFEELGGRKSPIQDKVCSDGDACRKMKCSYYRDCYYFKARRRWESAQVVVANHALLAIDAMMPEDSKILPPADVLVIDEAHSLDGVLSDQIGINLSKYKTDTIFNRFLRLDERGAYKGLLSGSPELFGPVEAIREETGIFWSRVAKSIKDRAIIRNAARLSEALYQLSGSLRDLAAAIKVSILGLFQEDEEIEMEAALLNLVTLSGELLMYADGAEGFVRWAEVDEKRTALRMAPIYPRDFVKDNIVPHYRSLVLTSATLATRGDFGFIQNILGLRDAKTLSLPSPFDLKSQVSVSIERGIDLKHERGIEKLSDVIRSEAGRRDGGILVLFTSRDIMNKTWELLADELRDIGRLPMLQGAMQNRTMLELMREGPNGVIFGLESFWEGVDLKGDSLTCLIITKLPFDVPSDPMFVARREAIERAGGNPFSEYAVPKAILKFKQGFGRLIRSKQDTGRVIICDERIATMRYGRRFLESLE
jgi:ATP-dependent DNA helicase DinG